MVCANTVTHVHNLRYLVCGPAGAHSMGLCIKTLRLIACRCQAMFAVMAITFSASFTCRYAGSHLVDNRLCMLTTNLTPTSRCRYALTCSCALAGSPPDELLGAQAHTNRVRTSSSAQQVSMLASSFFAACIFQTTGASQGSKHFVRGGGSRQGER